MLEQMPSSLFLEWWHSFEEEPWGYDAEVHRHAELCQLLSVGLLNGKKVPTYKDFIYPKLSEASDPEDDEDESSSRNSGMGETEMKSILMSAGLKPDVKAKG